MPPKPVEICETFSTLNLGKQAPNPIPKLVIPKVIPAMVMAESHIMKGVAFINRSVVMISSSTGISRKKKLTQNLLQTRVRSFNGDDLRIQKDLPSRLMLGKVKRTATAAMTNAASPRLIKDIKF